MKSTMRSNNVNSTGSRPTQETGMPVKGSSHPKTRAMEHIQAFRKPAFHQARRVPLLQTIMMRGDLNY